MSRLCRIALVGLASSHISATGDRFKMFALWSKSLPRMLVGLALLVSSTACTQSVEIQYRLIVTVSDNGTTRQGSGVWKTTIARPLVALVSAADKRFDGDAISVLLPGRGVLLLLPAARGRTSTDVETNVLISAFGGQARKGILDPVERFRHIAQLGDISVRLNCDYESFKNVSTTRYYLENPEIYNECFELAFVKAPYRPDDFHAADTVRDSVMPSGIIIRSVVLQLTKDPVTRSIDQILPLIVANEMKKTMLMSGPGIPADDQYRQLIRR